MSSLLNKTASVMHKQHGYYVSDSWTDTPVGSWGTKDGDLFERIGALKDVNRGVPDPQTRTITRTRFRYRDRITTRSRIMTTRVTTPSTTISISTCRMPRLPNL